ncbi:MAG: methyltransferase [Conexivisphaerales archaeon]
MDYKLERDALSKVPKGFKKIGNAIILESNRDFGKHNKEIGEEIIKRTGAESVFLKIGKIEGEERVPKLKLIAGNNKSVFLTKENGCSFYVNVRKSFFDPGMQNERKRIYDQEKEGEKVLDMFAGVGPFSILLAKKAKIVYSIEINRYAYNLLLRNIKINKTKNIVPILGDARKVVKKMNLYYDRIIMNLPAKAEEFLEYALKRVNRGTIHLYKFVNYYGSTFEGECKKIIDSIKNRYDTIGRVEFVKCGDTAPYTSRVCFDIQINTHLTK